jgi:hypothetical protein
MSKRRYGYPVLCVLPERDKRVENVMLVLSLFNVKYNLVADFCLN